MNEALREELVERAAADRTALEASLHASRRLGWRPLRDELLTEQERLDVAMTRRVQRDNTLRLREIVDEYGWPDATLVGAEAAAAAWLLAQHSDADRDLQQRVVLLMNAALERGTIEAGHLASLTDRVALANGEPQIYGTELTATGGVWSVQPPCDLERAEQLRASIGLPTIEEAVRELQQDLSATD
ncbi:MAG: DUF6624 domain-containing protein [Microthrixaceae bacterium]